MPLVRRFRGQRVTKDDLFAEWIRLSPEAYRAQRTRGYPPAVVHVAISGGHR